MQQAKRMNRYNETGVVVPAGDIRFKDRKVPHLPVFCTHIRRCCAPKWSACFSDVSS